MLVGCFLEMRSRVKSYVFCCFPLGTAAAYNDLIGPDQIFKYNFKLLSILKRSLYFEDDGTEVTEDIYELKDLDYDTSGHHNDINRRIQNQDTLFLSGLKYYVCIETVDNSENLNQFTCFGYFYHLLGRKILS